MTLSAREHHRPFWAEQLGCVPDQPFEPAQLKIKLRAQRVGVLSQSGPFATFEVDLVAA
jgi:hypothetical protein